MATHDYSLANQDGASFRSDLNNALAAIVSNNSSSTAPASTFAHQIWVDTTANVIKQRNAANDAWIELWRIDGGFNAKTFSSNVTLNAQSDLRFADSDSSNWVAFQAPATVASNVTWTLPSADGTADQALVTNGSGTLTWADSGGGDNITEGNTSAEVVDTGSDGHFKVITEGTERLRIDSDGVITSIGPSPATPVYENFLLTDSQTNSTTKRAGISCIHYNTAEEPFALVHAAASSSSNSLRIGGNPSTTTANTATEILFHTASNNTTTASSSTERMRITSDAYLRMASGSGGIQFGGDTADANALDDYEEGTWTPTIGGTATYNIQWGYYIKVGKLVQCWGGLRPSSMGTGNARVIQGLPFTAIASPNSTPTGGGHIVWCDYSATAFYNTPSISVIRNTTNTDINLKTGSSVILQNVADFWRANNRANFYITYQTN